MMMTSHGKLRREKGSLAEYESQMKGKSLWMCACVCMSVLFIALLFVDAHLPACMNA